MRAATWSTSSSSPTVTRSLVISSLTGVSGPRPSATPRTAMSRSVITPISRSPSVTGMAPASALNMKVAASRAVWSGRTVLTSRVITSLIFIVALLCEFATETNGRRGVFLRLRDVLGQEVVGRDQLVLLIEDLDRPAHLAGLFRLNRLGADREFDAHRISRIERRQEAEVLKAGGGEDGTRIGIDEQAGGEAQDQITVGDAALEYRRRLGGFLVHVRVEGVAGELREMLDVGDGDRAAAGLPRVADVKLAHLQAERVDVDDVLRAAGDILLGDGGDHGRRRLDRGALHVVLDPADAAHLLAAAGAAGAAVDQDRKRGAVAGRFSGVVAVEDEHPAVKSGGTLNEISSGLGRVREQRQGEASASAVRQSNRVAEIAIRHDRGNGTERLAVMDGGARPGIVGAKQDRGQE